MKEPNTVTLDNIHNKQRLSRQIKWFPATPDSSGNPALVRLPRKLTRADWKRMAGITNTKKEPTSLS